jgi:hypothetical protein
MFLKGKATGVTVVAWCWLLAVFASAVVDETEATFRMGPVEFTVTVIVTVAVAPLARVPRLQVTVPELSVQPAEDEEYVTPEGRESVTVTSAAESGPLFRTVIV